MFSAKSSNLKLNTFIVNRYLRRFSKVKGDAFLNFKTSYSRKWEQSGVTSKQQCGDRLDAAWETCQRNSTSVFKTVRLHLGTFCEPTFIQPQKTRAEKNEKSNSVFQNLWWGIKITWYISLFRKNHVTHNGKLFSTFQRVRSLENQMTRRITSKALPLQPHPTEAGFFSYPKQTEI